MTDDKKLFFRPKARIINTLGRDLISNDRTALSELVKNSYDAHSPEVEIIFDGNVKLRKDCTEKGKDPYYIRGKGSRILIIDEGVGMNMDIIKNAWMEPATDYKILERKNSEKGRKLLGEKGVGRFAASKIAKKLLMYTKTEKTNEIEIEFDWSLFEKGDYLDRMKFDYEENQKSKIINSNSGTTLILEDLNTDWTQKDLEELKGSLSRLINPFEPLSDFSINLTLPEQFSKLSGIIKPPPAFEKPHYIIKGNVDNEGNAYLEYFTRKKNNRETFDVSLVLKPSREPRCGVFEFEFRVWDLDSWVLKETISELKLDGDVTVSDIKNDLKVAGGISIFRDNFRVLPYGEPGVDWLRLDAMRINNPTMKLSNNQIVGYVSISLQDNPKLKDQTNREGIVDSQSFTDLKDLVKALLNQLEIRRYEERPRKAEPAVETRALFDIDIKDLESIVVKKLPQDKEVKAVLDYTKRDINKRVEKFKEIVSRYKRLSTLGQLVDIVLHDANEMLYGIELHLDIIKKELKKDIDNYNKIVDRLNQIDKTRKISSDLFMKLEPFSGRKRDKPKNILIEKVISNVLTLYKSEIERLKINIIVPKGEHVIKIIESDLHLIIINLLTNSLYWLETIKYERKLSIEIFQENEELCIVFSDNGSGIKDEHKDLIFEPYFSTKPEGTGLGLTIVGEIVSENNGSLELISDGTYKGASFKITFKNEKN